MKIVKLFIVLFITLICFNIKSYAEINVAFTIDNNYPIYTLLTINSILVNNTSNSDYHFWVIENNVTARNKKLMQKYVKKRNQKIDFIHISTDKIDRGSELYEHSLFAKHVSNMGAARIVLPDVLPQDIHKILYMDSDILVISDLKELYDTDISKYAAAMARNNSDVFEQVPEDKPSYFNSGVILINLDYWRKNNVSTKMLDCIHKNKLVFPDQDAINIILQGKVKKLDQKWNNQTNFLTTPLVPIDNGGIIHFIGSIKPWNVNPGRTPEVKIYYKYWNISGLGIYKYLRFKNVVLCYKITSHHCIEYIKMKIMKKLNIQKVATIY